MSFYIFFFIVFSSPQTFIKISDPSIFANVAVFRFVRVLNRADCARSVSSPLLLFFSGEEKYAEYFILFRFARARALCLVLCVELSLESFTGRLLKAKVSARRLSLWQLRKRSSRLIRKFARRREARRGRTRGGSGSGGIGRG